MSPPLYHSSTQYATHGGPSRQGAADIRAGFARLERAASSSARALVEQCEGAGDLHGALEWARRAAHLAPHAEDPLRRLVTLLERLGDRAGAVEAYDEFAKRLAADFEMEPAAETQALLVAVRARAAVGPVESPSRARAGVAPVAPIAPIAPSPRALWPRLSGAGVLGLLLAASDAAEQDRKRGSDRRPSKRSLTLSQIRDPSRSRTALSNHSNASPRSLGNASSAAISFARGRGSAASCT